MELTWEGVFTAITTQFNDNESIDFDLYSKNLTTQINAGIDGVIMGGTLGESSTLKEEELDEMVTFTLRQTAGIKPVVLNISEGSTRDAVRRAKRGEQLGAHGLMLLPPMRYLSDHRETVTFFKDVANATSLPIMIYNNPIDYKVLVTVEMFDELQECKNITAVKESTRDVSRINSMINRFGNRFKILCGVDTLALESILMGASGWVAGLVNAFPAETVAIYQLAKAGMIEESLRIHRWFLPLLELDLHPKLVQYIKLAAAKTKIGSENVRAPRLKLEGEERTHILNIIENGIKTSPELPDFINIPS